MSNFIDKFAKEVNGSGLCSSMRGCSDFEISDLEKHFNIKLPTNYKDFLRKMGKHAGLFMKGTDFYYGQVFNNRKAFEEVLALDEHSFILTKDIFVFSSHQGYFFHFFDTLEDEHDPPVYGYCEGDLKFHKVNETFSTFLSNSLKEQKKLCR